MFYISHVNLKNFRCFKNKSIQLSKKINVLVGKNAIGKTSIAEAIYYTGCCKSPRTSLDKELIKKDEEYFIIELSTVTDGEEDRLKIINNLKGKKVFKNEKIFLKLSDYIGEFKVVLFSPEDLRLVKGEPEIRRRFLDLFISQIDKKYLNSLIRYKKILKQKNEYLKNEVSQIDRIYLKTLVKALAIEALVLIDKRKEYINAINEVFNTKLLTISGNKEYGKLLYKPNTNMENLIDVFMENIEADILMKTTLKGPHKDDFEFIINGDKASSFASQGQQKSLALTLKLSQSEIYKKKSDKIVIILDDVFGELDNERQNNIIELLSEDVQIIITTTTTAEGLSEKVKETSKVIDMNEDGDTYE